MSRVMSRSTSRSSYVLQTLTHKGSIVGYSSLVLFAFIAVVAGVLTGKKLRSAKICLGREVWGPSPFYTTVSQKGERGLDSEMIRFPNPIHKGGDGLARLQLITPSGGPYARHACSNASTTLPMKFAPSVRMQVALG